MKAPKKDGTTVPHIQNMAEFRAKIVGLIEQEDKNLPTPLIGFNLVEVGANLLFTTEPQEGAAQRVIEKALEVAKQEVKSSDQNKGDNK